jgi:hypothetical protein
VAPWRGEPEEAEFDLDELRDLAGLDVSGSQAQILAVAMGLRKVEDQLAKTSFKQLVSLSIRALHREGKFRVPREVLENATWLENVAKDAGMPGLYGGKPSTLARDLQRDPDRYGPGAPAGFVAALFKHDPILRQLLAFLPIAEAVGHAAFERNPCGGVTVHDPLDGQAFTWNPPKRRKVQVGSGRFKLYVKAPVVQVGPGDGGYLVDKGKLVRRIAPGLIHMLDALFASIVVVFLNEQGVQDVVAIHDAFLVPESAYRELGAALDAAGRTWLPLLGPFYDVFNRYLPATSPEGKIAREWRARWEQRVADCEAGRDTWPDFRTKHEGSEYR